MAVSIPLNIISAELLVFEEKPKIIEGRKIHDWFITGENIFEYFFNLGTHLSWDFSKLNNEPEAARVMDLVKRNISSIQSFISLYQNFRIDCDMVGSAGDVCRTRSGLEALFRGFKGLESDFDTILIDLEDAVDLEDFDRVLKVWIDSGHRPDFLPKDISPNTPKSHWWWL